MTVQRVESPAAFRRISLAGRRALVTGATGFLGSHLVRDLLAAGCHVAVLVRDTRRLDRLQGVRDRVDLIEGDVASRSSIERINSTAASDLVFHFAAAGTDQRVPSVEALVQTNVQGPLNVFELACRGGAVRFIYAGSSAEYGRGSHLTERSLLHPESVYGASKAAAGMLLHAAGKKQGLPVVAIRFFSPFGPFEHAWRLVPHVILHALQGRDVPLTPGHQRRDFLFVDDAIEAVLLAAVCPGVEGEVMNVCTGQETRVRDLVSTILKLMGHPVRPLFGAVSYRADEPGCLSGDPAAAKQRLGWAPTLSLEAGLQQTIQWIRGSQKAYANTLGVTAAR